MNMTIRIIEVDVYDNEIYGDGDRPGCCASAYAEDYADTGADPVIRVFIPDWYPPHLDDDHWLYPPELPRRIRRALINQGAEL